LIGSRIISDKNMPGEFHNGARHAVRGSAVLRKCANAAITPAYADAGSAGAAARRRALE